MMELFLSEIFLPGLMVIIPLSLIIAAISLSIAKRQMSSIASAREASKYASSNVRLSQKDDRFLGSSQRLIASNRTNGTGSFPHGGPGGPSGYAGGIHRPGAARRARMP